MTHLALLFMRSKHLTQFGDIHVSKAGLTSSQHTHVVRSCDLGRVAAEVSVSISRCYNTYCGSLSKAVDALCDIPALECAMAANHFAALSEQDSFDSISSPDKLTTADKFDTATLSVALKGAR